MDNAKVFFGDSEIELVDGSWKSDDPMLEAFANTFAPPAAYTEDMGFYVPAMEQMLSNALTASGA